MSDSAEIVPIDKLVELLRAAFENGEDPADTDVLGILRDHPVDPASLESYLDYRDDKYTRSLVYRGPKFEAIVLCWESGQISRIHNHAGQRCWMAVSIGKLQVVNYAVTAGDELGSDNGHCVIEPTNDFWMTPAAPGMVDLRAPIHSVGNPADVGARAVSVHVYSLPYDFCMIYDREANLATKVELSFDNAQSMPLA